MPVTYTTSVKIARMGAVTTQSGATAVRNSAAITHA